MIRQVAGLSCVAVVHQGRAEQLDTWTRNFFRILLRALRRLIEQSIETPIEQPATIRRWGR
jgi:hypothetical protein